MPDSVDTPDQRPDEPRVTVCTRIAVAGRDAVLEMAGEEQRTLSDMLRILISEAVHARRIAAARTSQQVTRK